MYVYTIMITACTNLYLDASHRLVSVKKCARHVSYVSTLN